ncbi:MAG: glycosyltransferase [Ruminococcaceae bacterium]|nr:glycosyltransferase [Oscillospiraceae bacterium]
MITDKCKTYLVDKCAIIVLYFLVYKLKIAILICSGEMRKMISIISMSYNSDVLFESIDSVLSQNYPEVEYIVIDDGSENFEENKVSDYINQNKKENFKTVKILCNSENKGTVYSINRAIKESTGKYIFCLGCDDFFYDSNVITDWVEFFDRTGALVSTAKMAVYTENEFVGIQPTEEQIKNITELTPKELFTSLSTVNYIFGCCTARSRECIEKYGYFNKKIKYIEDHSMNLRLLRMGEKIRFFDRIVVRYNTGGISSYKKLNKAFEEDADRVQEYEVYPYVDDVEEAKRKYEEFKKDKLTSIKQYKYSLKLLKNKDKPFKTALIKISYYVTHPVMFVRKLIKK